MVIGKHHDDTMRSIDFSGLFSQIEKMLYMRWFPVTDKLWHSIRWEGLDNRFGNPLKDQWEYIEMEISSTDRRGLMELDDDVVEKYSKFDMQMKQKYRGVLVTVIDYTEGTVMIVRSRYGKYLKDFPT